MGGIRAGESRGGKADKNRLYLIYTFACFGENRVTAASLFCFYNIFPAVLWADDND